MTGPPESFVDLPDDELFTRFALATATLKVDESGLSCLPTEAVALARLTRQVRERAGIDSPLNQLATRVHLLLGYHAMAKVPNPELVAWFYRDRAELADCLPAKVVAMLDDVSDIGPRGPRFAESDDADAIAANERIIEQARDDELGFGPNN